MWRRRVVLHLCTVHDENHGIPCHRQPMPSSPNFSPDSRYSAATMLCNHRTFLYIPFKGIIFFPGDRLRFVYSTVDSEIQCTIPLALLTILGTLTQSILR